MNDNITLPREVVKFVLQHLEWWSDDEPQEKEAITALRAALAAEPTKPVVISKDWLKMTLQVNRGDRVLKVERWLHLSEIKQSRFPLVKATADSAWQELDAAMKEDKK